MEHNYKFKITTALQGMKNKSRAQHYPNKEVNYIEK